VLSQFAGIDLVPNSMDGFTVTFVSECQDNRGRRRRSGGAKRRAQVRFHAREPMRPGRIAIIDNRGGAIANVD